jgi:hypothetical protein
MGWTLQKIIIPLLFHYYFAVDPTMSCCAHLVMVFPFFEVSFFSFTVIIEVPFR